MKNLYRIGITAAVSCSSLIGNVPLRENPASRDERKTLIRYALISAAAATGAYTLFKLYQSYKKGDDCGKKGDGSRTDVPSVTKAEVYAHPELIYDDKTVVHLVRSVDPKTLEIKTLPIDKPMIFHSSQVQGEDTFESKIDQASCRIKLYDARESLVDIDIGDLQQALLRADPELTQIIIGVEGVRWNVVTYSYDKLEGRMVARPRIYETFSAFEKFKNACDDGEKAVLVLIPSTMVPESILE